MASKYDKMAAEIAEMYKNGGHMSMREVARELNIPFSSVQRAVKKHREKKSERKIEKDVRKDSAVITVRSLDIKTLEDALRVTEMDSTVWEVERYLVNSWEVTLNSPHGPETYTNFQVKVWMRRKVKDHIEEGIKLLLKEIPKFRPPKYTPPRKSGGFALEMALYDAHFGKLAWGKETMQGDYDIERAKKAFLSSTERNLFFASPFKPEKIFYILGQDLMHVENIWGVTPVGQNRLDMDTRFPKIYKAAKEAVLQSLYMCMEIAPVEVLWIPGNHDIHASYFVSDIAKEHFRNTDRIQIDNTPPWRKARLWGNLLVGYTHDASGNRAQVTVNMLPQFWPELWGKSKYREWHTGHKHKKQEMKFMPTQTVGGVIVRQIPTLSTIDAWHYQEGFVDAVPAGESLVWSKENGIVAHYTAYVD